MAIDLERLRLQAGGSSSVRLQLDKIKARRAAGLLEGAWIRQGDGRKTWEIQGRTPPAADRWRHTAVSPVAQPLTHEERHRTPCQLVVDGLLETRYEDRTTAGQNGRRRRGRT